jgi:zinc/manganese transport system substrate-binding protein
MIRLAIVPSYVFWALTLLLCAPIIAVEPLKVLATVPTYGELAREVGGELVDVVVLCRPGQDVHSVSATPSMMARCRSADLVLHTGLDAELWLPDLLRGSANPQLLPGNPNSIDLSSQVALKQVPTELTRAQGDLHAFGNTHVWTDPLAVRTMAAQVRDALVAALPEHAEELTARHAAFHERLTRALVKWLTRVRVIRDKPLVVYHRSWVYFLDRLSLVQTGTIEPKPRVAPTASHLDELIDAMDRADVRVVLREPYQFPDAADFVAERTGARVLVLATHPGYPEGVDGIIEHFDHNIGALIDAMAPPELGGSEDK